MLPYRNAHAHIQTKTVPYQLAMVQSAYIKAGA